MELKGSASTSLMKAIIGQSNNVSNRASSLTSAPSSLLHLGMHGMPYMSSPSNNVALDALNELDLLNNWDIFNSDNVLGSGDLNISCGPNTGTTNSPPVWDSITSQLKETQQPNNIAVNQIGSMNKRQPTMNFQLQRGHSGGHSGSMDGPKSPRFTPSPGGHRGPGYSLQTQRNMPNMMGYPTQRSPGVAGVGVHHPTRQHPAQFNVHAYQQRKTIMSPGECE